MPVALEGAIKASETQIKNGFSISQTKDFFEKEINGLRGVAILLVVLFHYEIFPFSGGFIGVDIFFVISGYLITRIILAELQETNKFSFINAPQSMDRIIKAFKII